MTLELLIQMGRRKTMDLATPQFWSDDEWIDYLNEATEEACIRSRLIVDDQIELDVSAGDPYVEYPARVWSIRKVIFNKRKLDLVDREMLDASEAENWEEQSGDPRACFEVAGKLRFFPTPEIAGTARMEGFCIPADRLGLKDEPPIPVRLHSALLDWALFLAYLKNDAETFDSEKAEVHAGRFEQAFGSRPDERSMRRMRINVRRFTSGAYF